MKLLSLLLPLSSRREDLHQRFISREDYWIKLKSGSNLLPYSKNSFPMTLNGCERNMIMALIFSQTTQPDKEAFKFCFAFGPLRVSIFFGSLLGFFCFLLVCCFWTATLVHCNFSRWQQTPNSSASWLAGGEPPLLPKLFPHLCCGSFQVWAFKISQSPK